MNATIITIGDELLIGQVVDTNSTWLGAELTKMGFNITSKIAIGDSKVAIEEALDYFLQQNDLLIISGGLGPTKDDITKNVLSTYFDSPLYFSDDVLADVTSFLAHRGSKMNDLNRAQAMFPQNAILLRNKQGTAPGMWFEQKGKIIISVPGVPSEMKGIFTQEIKSRLEAHFKLIPTIYKTVLITGIAEAHLAERLADWEMNLPPNMLIAYLPSPGLIKLRLGIYNKDTDYSIQIIEEHIELLKQIIPNYIFGYNDDTLVKSIANILISNGHTLATAESCTGGNIAHELTLEPGCSSWFKGSIVAYNNSVKQMLIGVSESDLLEYGAVSKPVVEQMALGTKKQLNTDYAIATSGIAGPSGGTTEKPVGMVWIAICGPNFVESKLFTFGKNREINIKVATMAALAFFRRKILSV